MFLKFTKHQQTRNHSVLRLAQLLLSFSLCNTFGCGYVLTSHFASLSTLIDLCVVVVIAVVVVVVDDVDVNDLIVFFYIA